MKLTRDIKTFLELVARSEPVIEEWCRVSDVLTSYALTAAMSAPDMVEFGINKNHNAFVRLTEKGKKRFKQH